MGEKKCPANRTEPELPQQVLSFAENGMEWIKIIGMVLLCIVLISVLRQYNATYAVVAGIACCCIVFVAALSALMPVIDFLSSMAERISVVELMPVLKAMGIIILAQIARDVCKDAGQSALAGQVELAARALVLFSALPLFRQLLQIVCDPLG